MFEEQEQPIADNRGYWGYRELTKEEANAVSGGGCGSGCGGCGCGSSDSSADTSASCTGTSENCDGTNATSQEGTVTTSPLGDDRSMISVTDPAQPNASMYGIVGPDGLEEVGIIGEDPTPQP